MSSQLPDERQDLFRAIEAASSQMVRLHAQFEAATTDAEKWPIALRMLRLGPRLLSLHQVLERMN